MPRVSRLLTSWSIAGVLLVTARGLRAEEAPSRRAEPSPVATLKKEDAPLGAVRISVSTDEDRLLLTVARPGERKSIVSCYRQCSFWGVRGSYTLWATNQERGVHYQTTLETGQHTAFKASSGSPVARTGGLVAGIAGPIAIVGGMALFIVQVLGDPPCDPSPGRECTKSRRPIGLALFGGGILATVIGWTTFATAGPRVDAVEEKPAQRPPLRAKLDVMRFSSQGWGVAISARF